MGNVYKKKMMKASSASSGRLRLLLHCTKFSSSVSFSSFGSSSPYFTSPSSKIGSSSVSFKSFSSFSNNNQGNNNIVDTLIIGGGPIGSSTAYHLGHMFQEQGQQHHNRNYNIVVLEKDPSYNSSSATSSAGGIRQHFSLKENILMSMYGRDFLRNCGRLLTPSAILDNTTCDGNGDDEGNGIVDVQFVENGYLFLTDNEIGKLNLIENNKVQRDANCTTTQLTTPTELATKFPWLNTSDLLLGSYGTSGEGWFDPWLYIQALKKKNQDDLGITYITGKPIRATRDDVSGRILSVDILLSRGDGDVSTTSSSSSSDIMTVHVNNVVNAAGAYASELMNLLSSDKSLKYPLPVVPRKRCIFYFHCAAPQDDHHVIIPEIAPLTVDSSNVYFRSEGKPGSNTYICGVSPSSEDDIDFTGQTREVTEEDYQDLFLERIWPSIYHRVPAFANIKVINSWSGLYEYNVVDQNAIIDYHPEIPNVLLVNGFSGHGLQQSPAAGRAIAELILFDGEYQSLDLSIFKFDRCMMDEDGQPIRPPVFERGIV